MKSYLCGNPSVQPERMLPGRVKNVLMAFPDLKTPTLINPWAEQPPEPPVQMTPAQIRRTKKIQELTLHMNSFARQSIRALVALGRELKDQKESLPHGAWLPWLRQNVPFSDQTARNYIRVYEGVRQENRNKRGKHRVKFKNILNLVKHYYRPHLDTGSEPPTPHAKVVKGFYQLRQAVEVVRRYTPTAPPPEGATFAERVIHSNKHALTIEALRDPDLMHLTLSTVKDLLYLVERSIEEGERELINPKLTVNKLVSPPETPSGSGGRNSANLTQYRLHR